MIAGALPIGSPLLRMTGITKRFRGVTAVSDVNFDLSAGEIHALCGENGAGKSTLMKILSGSYPASSYDGTIHVNGARVEFHTTRDAEAAGIEMIYQEISLNPELSVSENIFLGRLPTFPGTPLVDWRAMHGKAADALAAIGLDVDPRRTIRYLSTSQQQMIAIAKALTRNPKILVLDEPTSALTDREATTLKELIRSLGRNGTSSIYISHKLDEVFEIADRVTVLRDGKVVSTVPRSDVSPQRVVEDMVGRKLESLYPKEIVPKGAIALRVENLSVASHIPGKRAVDGVSFEVARGEILGLGGLVGSGRSEIVSAIMGVKPRLSGRIMVHGKDVDIRSPRDAVRARIGLVTEDRRASGLVQTIDVAKNVSLASLRKIRNSVFLDRAREQSIVGELIEKLALKPRSTTSDVTTLSGGNQQKVVLAKWLMTDVEILLLDEPTRGIDVGAKAEIYGIIVELARNGVAIILISSELPELIAMMDRCLVLRDGRLVHEFNRDTITENGLMHYATGAAEIEEGARATQ